MLESRGSSSEKLKALDSGGSGGELPCRGSLACCTAVGEDGEDGEKARLPEEDEVPAAVEKARADVSEAGLPGKVEGVECCVSRDKLAILLNSPRQQLSEGFPIT